MVRDAYPAGYIFETLDGILSVSVANIAAESSLPWLKNPVSSV